MKPAGYHVFVGLPASCHLRRRLKNPESLRLAFRECPLAGALGAAMVRPPPSGFGPGLAHRGLTRYRGSPPPSRKSRHPHDFRSLCGQGKTRGSKLAAGCGGRATARRALKPLPAATALIPYNAIYAREYEHLAHVGSVSLVESDPRPAESRAPAEVFPDAVQWARALSSTLPSTPRGGDRARRPSWPVGFPAECAVKSRTPLPRYEIGRRSGGSAGTPRRLFPACPRTDR